MNIEESKNLLKYIIINNRNLEKQGKKTTAVELQGQSGIGKTSAVIQVANELGMQFIKLNLSQIEELGDLVGYPIKEYYVCAPTGECLWVPSDSLEQYRELGYTLHNNMHRMGYALPQWVPTEECNNGLILLLDDYNRANPRIMQACMELIDRGTYISWSIPKNCTIVLSSNPDDGQYQVSYEDNAMKTRRIKLDVEFDIKPWAKWAESENIDERLINFALLYPEIFNLVNNVQTVNARSYVTFANCISGIEDFNTPESLGLIMSIASGCFQEKNNNIGTMFATFIANKLDRLISAESLLFDKWETVQSQLKNCVYDGDVYRADIANILTTRLINRIFIYFDKEKGKATKVISRLEEIINNDKVLLSEDLIFYCCKTLIGQYPKLTTKLVANPTIRQKLL